MDSSASTTQSMEKHRGPAPFARMSAGFFVIALICLIFLTVFIGAIVSLYVNISGIIYTDTSLAENNCNNVVRVIGCPCQKETQCINGKCQGGFCVS